MIKIKELMDKIADFIEWLFGAIVVIGCVIYGIKSYSTDFEQDRLTLAKDILGKVIRLGMEEDGETISQNAIDLITDAAKNKNKAECGKSVIYYGFTIDSEIIWIKTEKSRDAITAEFETEDVPQTCTFYEKINNKWKKVEHLNDPQKQATTTHSNNNVSYSSCDSTVVNLSVDTGCKYGKDTIKMEIQSQQTTQYQSLYSQRFCVKGNVLTLLMGEEQNFDKNNTAFHSLPQIHPQNINCQKLIDWLDNYGGMTMGIDNNEEPLYLGGRVG